MAYSNSIYERSSRACRRCRHLQLVGGVGVDAGVGPGSGCRYLNYREGVTALSVSPRISTEKGVETKISPEKLEFLVLSNWQPTGVKNSR